jgi:hypothetical protein
MADETTNQAPAQIEIPTVTFDKPQFDTFMQILDDSQEDVPDENKRPVSELFAQQLTNEARAQYPELFSYEGLKDGTAGIFDVTGDTRQPNLRKMTADEIIQLFARDLEGNPIQPATFLEGFKREGVRQAGGFAGAAAGYKAGTMLAAPIPPVTPPTAAAKFLIPLGTSIGGFFLGYEGGDIGQEALFGDEQPILPSHREAYEAGKTAAGVAAFLPVPFMLGTKLMPANLGMATYLNNVATRRAAQTKLAEVEKVTSQIPYGPPTPVQAEAMAALPAAREAVEATAGMSTAAKTQAELAKDPLLQRLAFGFENAMARGGEMARSAPKSTLAFEGFIGAGQTAGAFMAEETAPGSVGYRLA